VTDSPSWTQSVITLMPPVVPIAVVVVSPPRVPSSELLPSESSLCCWPSRAASAASSTASAE
jgi:hypothetical protein